MFDLEKVRSEGEKFAKQMSELLEMNLTTEGLIGLYFAGLGKTRADLYLTTLFYSQEGDRCRTAGAYFSACLMTASAVEALLAVLCLSSQQHVEALPTLKRKSLGKMARVREHTRAPASQGKLCAAEARHIRSIACRTRRSASPTLCRASMKHR